MVQAIVIEHLEQLDETSKGEFFYIKIGENWVYLLPREVKDDKVLKNMYFAVLSKEHHPEKYRNFATVLYDFYKSTPNPVVLLQHYLTAMGTGKMKIGEFNHTKYPKPDVPEAAKKIFDTFSTDDITTIWTGLMLKKKIIVVCGSVGELLEVTSVLPHFVPHRKMTNIRPFVDFESTLQVKEFQKLNHYVVGSITDVEDEDIFDLLINVTTKSVKTAGYSDHYFDLTAIHTNVLNILNDETLEYAEYKLEKIKQENEDVISKLKNLHEQFEGELTIDEMKQLNMSEKLEAFMINLAVAEGLITVN